MARMTGFAAGASLGILAVILFDLMGLVIKHLSPFYGAAEISAYRNLFGLLPSVVALALSPAWRRGGRRLKLRQWRLACLRGVATTCAQFSLYFALGRMAFATANTISFAMAIFTVAYAGPLLGEKVGPVRWAATLLGFAGVVMVMRPGSATFDWVALAPLAAAAFYGFLSASARLMDDDAPSPLVNLYASAVATVGAAGLALATGGFTPVRGAVDFGWIVAMGGLGGLAVLCWVIAFRVTDASNLAPLTYFGIPTAYIFGWLFFGEAPFEALFPGALLIVASGLIIFWRERRLRF